jgi:hypothetical protein
MDALRHRRNANRSQKGTGSGRFGGTFFVVGGTTSGAGQGREDYLAFIASALVALDQESTGTSASATAKANAAAKADFAKGRDIDLSFGCHSRRRWMFAARAWKRE